MRHPREACPECGRHGFAVDDVDGVTLGYCHRATCGFGGRLTADGWQTGGGDWHDRRTAADDWTADAFATLTSSTDRRAGAALRLALDLGRIAAVHGLDLWKPSLLTLRERTGATSGQVVNRGRDLLVALDLLVIDTNHTGRQSWRLRHSMPGTRSLTERHREGGELYRARSVAMAFAAPLVRRDSLGPSALLGLGLVLVHGSGTGADLARAAGLPTRTAQRRLATAAKAGLVTTSAKNAGLFYGLSSDLAGVVKRAEADVADAVDRNRATVAGDRDRRDARRAEWRVRRWLAAGAAPPADMVADVVDRLTVTARGDLAVMAAALPDGHVLRWHLPPLSWDAPMRARGVLHDVATGRRKYRPRCHRHLAAMLTEADAATLATSHRLDRSHPLVGQLRHRAGLTFTAEAVAV